MFTPSLSISRRIRETPFTKKVEEAGIKGYTVYNHMLLPTIFESVEADYHHLKQHVQIWDVSCERQIEIKGKDAAALVQMLTPRNLSKMGTDQCYYIPVVDQTGGMLNDPVAIKHNDTHWWVSLADSDLKLWVKGIAEGRGLDVTVTEPDVSPLGVQGPKADALMARVFGDAVHDIKFFRHARLNFEDTAFTVARSGYSKQGGFEIYLEGSHYGSALWEALFAAGDDLEVRAGCPNLIERIEGGLLSYGNDMTEENTPFECGLGKFCHVENVTSCIGSEALREEARNGPKRQLRGVKISGEKIDPCRSPWPLLATGTSRVGQVTSSCWSPDLKTNIGIAMIDKSHWEPGTQVEIETPDGMRRAEVCTLPFV